MSESTEKHLEKIVLELRDGNTRYSIEVLELKNKLNCAVRALDEYVTFYDDKTKDMCDFEDFRFEWVKRARLALEEIKK